MCDLTQRHTVQDRKKKPTNVTDGAGCRIRNQLRAAWVSTARSRPIRSRRPHRYMAHPSSTSRLAEAESGSRIQKSVRHAALQWAMQPKCQTAWLETSKLVALNTYADAAAWTGTGKGTGVCAAACSQFAFWGTATPTGRTVTGRNMDGENDIRKLTVNALVLYALEPAEADQQRVVHVMWPGFFGMSSGFNAAGRALPAPPPHARQASPRRGWPPLQLVKICRAGHPYAPADAQRCNRETAKHAHQGLKLLPTPPPLRKHGQGQKNNGHTGSWCLDKPGLARKDP